MEVLLNDPPRERSEGTGSFVSMKEIQNKADIITFHVPLNKKGEDATYHLVDEKFIQNLKKQPLLINSCRGEVFKTEALKNSLKSGKISGLIADCWENEPDIDLELLALADYGTPHIAGYSKDGKACLLYTSGIGKCVSTGQSAARTSWVLDEMVKGYYGD